MTEKQQDGELWCGCIEAPAMPDHERKTTLVEGAKDRLSVVEVCHTTLKFRDIGWDYEDEGRI